MNKTLLKKDFWPVEEEGSHDVFVEDIGWSDYHKQDAMSDNPEKIFRYYVEVVGLNILFYWIVDEQFYTIFTESLPIEVKRIYPNPDWDGKYEYLKAGEDVGPSTWSDGELIASFDDPTKIWDELKINGVSIGDVLKQSILITLD